MVVRLGEVAVILDLHRQGSSVSAIAARTSLDRKTVRKYITAGLEPPAYGPRQPCPTKVAPYPAFLRERVAAYPELAAVQLHREIGELGYGGGQTAVKEFLREVRPRPVPGFEVRFETPPGRQAQVDFACFRTVFTDEPGIERVVWAVLARARNSRMLWGRFVPQQDLQTVLRCRAAAFEALRGTPAEILYDRMKTVVDREVVQEGVEPGHVVHNRTLVGFARHYGYRPKSCKAYRAKTKGKVERPFRYVRENFFLGRSFRSLDDLNGHFRQWLDQVANVRVHATARRVVREHFAGERPSLQPLPAGPFQAVLRLERRITKDGTVSGPAISTAYLHHASPPGRSPQHRRQGPHLGGRPHRCRASRHGGPRPAPYHGRTSHYAAAGQQPDTPPRTAGWAIQRCRGAPPARVLRQPGLHRPPPGDPPHRPVRHRQVACIDSDAGSEATGKSLGVLDC